MVEQGCDCEEQRPETVSMIEEPLEQRLQRAWLNGFREGMERASWMDGRWDR